MVYSRGDFGYANHITHYYALNLNNQWIDYKQVSENGDVDAKPTVSFSQNRVHASYHEDYNAEARDKYLSSWQTPVQINSSSIIERIHVGSSKLLYFYDEPQPDLFINLYVKYRNLNETSWSSPTLIQEHSSYSWPFVSATSTPDGKTHIFYGGTIYKKFDGSTWTSPLVIGDNFEFPLISSVSKDLFVMWFGTNGYVKYRMYDDSPLPPQNVQVVRDANDHPLISWSANTEPDLDHYVVEKAYQGDWVLLTSTTGLSYEDPNETYCTVPPPGVCEAGHTVYYRVKAVDKNSHQSDPSNEVRAYVEGQYPDKRIPQNSQAMTYKLDQNYPNPFNPATSISYSLEKDGFVNLKVYDMLGKEVAELVNENQTEGNYTIEFNAVNFPSGIYFYQIKSGSFSDIKKMLLVK